MLVLNRNILTIGGNRLEGGPLTPPEPPIPPGPSFDEVTIGTQTWMSKNLAIDDGGTGITIKDNVTANGVNFGTQYYYNWDAAVRIAASVEGWHLPTQAECDALVTAVGGSSNAGTKLKSTSGWNDNSNGTDDYGFTVFPVGDVLYANLSYVGRWTDFWTSTEYNVDKAYYLKFYTSKNSTSGNRDKYYGYSVRLIKDT